MNAMFRAALRRLFGRWTRKRGLSVPDRVRPDVLARLTDVEFLEIIRHYETGGHAPLSWHDIMAHGGQDMTVGLPKRHTVPVTDALDVDRPVERVNRLPCFGGPLDGEALTDVEFYADGSFAATVTTDVDMRGGAYAWCRLSNRAVWTQDR